MFRHSLKPWWSEELQTLWDEMHVCEHDYVKTPRSDPSFKAKFRKFRDAEKKFDKTNKRSKRKHQRQEVNNIEKANTDDPVAFWDFIKRLNPRRKDSIPWEACVDGNVYYDKCEVMNHWTDEFAKLLTPPEGDEVSRIRLENITQDNRESCVPI